MCPPPFSSVPIDLKTHCNWSQSSQDPHHETDDKPLPGLNTSVTPFSSPILKHQVLHTTTFNNGEGASVSKNLKIKLVCQTLLTSFCLAYSTITARRDFLHFRWMSYYILQVSPLICAPRACSMASSGELEFVLAE